MKRHIACCLLILGLQTVSYAQSRTHIFPHIADGFFTSGWYYTSTIAVAPWLSGGATCAVNLQGLEADFGSGRTNSFTFQMPEDGYWIESTDGRQPITTGYAAMECDAYVNAHLVFSYYTPDGQLFGEATVFSSEEGFSYTAEFLVDMSGGARFGVAIANLRSLPSDFALTFKSAGRGDITATVTVPERSNRAFFLLEELANIPSGSKGILEIKNEVFDNFGTVGLRFVGEVFSTVPAN